MNELPFISKTMFQQNILSFKGLVQLELRNANNLGPKGLIRIMQGSRETLQYVSLPYQSVGVDNDSLQILS